MNAVRIYLKRHDEEAEKRRNRVISIGIGIGYSVPAWAAAKLFAMAPSDTEIIGVSEWDLGRLWVLGLRSMAFPEVPESIAAPVIPFKMNTETREVSVEWPLDPLTAAEFI